MSHVPDTRPFPIQGTERTKEKPCTIPWWLAKVAYERYCHLYGDKQSMEKIADRGGFSRRELLALLVNNPDDPLTSPPGDVTAISLAQRCGWTSRTGAPHNLAVILAAVNEGYDSLGLMVTRVEEGPNGHPYESHVFTSDGASRFVQDIDAKAPDGQFYVEPTERALALGYKNKRTVTKIRPPAPAEDPPR